MASDALTEISVAKDMRAISIGTNCQAEFQTRRAFESSSSFLSWLLVEVNAIIWLIENDFRLPINDDCIEYFQENTPMIRHKDHGLFWMHDFPLDSPDAYRDDIARVRAKYDHLANKWRMDLADPNPILFVCSECDLRAFDGIAQALVAKRGNLPYHVLVTRSEHRANPDDYSYEPADPRVTSAIIKQDLSGSPTAWHGLTEEWDRAFGCALTEAGERGVHFLHSTETLIAQTRA